MFMYSVPIGYIIQVHVQLYLKVGLQLVELLHLLQGLDELGDLAASQCGVVIGQRGDLRGHLCEPGLQVLWTETIHVHTCYIYNYNIYMYMYMYINPESG